MDWKQLGKKFLFPPGFVIWLLVLFSTVSLILVFVNGWENSPVAYAIYVTAFYTLSIICLVCWNNVPRYYRQMKERLYKNEYINRYFTDAAFKTHVSLYGSLLFNLLYVVINAVSAVVYHTHWFAIFAVYYAIMAMMRFLLLRYVGSNQIGESRLGELKRARLCAYILLTVNLVLSGVVLMMIYFERGFSYQGFLIYVIALYTFYITTTAIIEMVKYRKYQSPIMSMSKLIKLAAALFSMLFLETAMFSQFGGDMSKNAQRIMIMATGGGISVIVVTMAIYMIVRTTKEIRGQKQIM